MSKEVYKKSCAGDSSKEILTAVEKAENLAKTNLPKIKTTTSFIGVGLSALLLIPLMCSILIKGTVEAGTFAGSILGLAVLAPQISHSLIHPVMKLLHLEKDV